MAFMRFLIENRLFLLAGFLLSFTSSYGQTYFISLFAGEIRSEFGLTNGEWGGIYTLGTTVSALLMVWAGGLTDHFRVRRLLVFVLTGLALACLAMAAVPSGWALIPVIFALRFTGQGMTSQLSVVAMARWFVAARGKALSVASMGFAVAQAILPMIFVAAMVSVPWRWLWVVAAGLVVVAIPVLLGLLSLERTPQMLAKSEQSLGMGGRHWSRRDLLGHWLFWMMVPLLLGPPAWGTALFFQQVHLTEVKGWPLSEFVALFPIFTLVLVASTFASGWATDRFGTDRLVPLLLVPFAAGFIVLAQASTISGAGIGLILVGVGNGMQATVPGAFWAEHYGTRHLGSIKATAAAIMVFGSAIGPGISGYLIDAGYDFPAQMPAIAVYFLAAGALASFGVWKAARSGLTA